MGTYIGFFKNVDRIVKNYDKEAAEKKKSPMLINNINMIVFVLTVTATQKVLCRLWPYCLSPGKFLRPSILSSEDSRTLWHSAKKFQFKKKGLFRPGNSIIIAKEEKDCERKERGRNTAMSSAAFGLFRRETLTHLCFRDWMAKRNLSSCWSPSSASVFSSLALAAAIPSGTEARRVSVACVASLARLTSVQSIFQISLFGDLC